MIGAVLILTGCVSIFLAISKFHQYQEGAGDFGPIDTTGLHPIWKYTFKLMRFDAHFDVWMYGILGPLAIVAGIVAIIRGD